jgi:hypothetical protein
MTQRDGISIGQSNYVQKDLTLTPGPGAYNNHKVSNLSAPLITIPK